MPHLTRRHVLASAAATAAVAAMPAASAFAAVEEAPIGLLTIDTWAEANLDPFADQTAWRLLSNEELLALLRDPTWDRLPSPDNYYLADLDDDGKRIR